MNSSLVLLVVLGILITTLGGKTTASRNTRQAARCSAGQQCILLRTCPELLTLLNTPEGISRLQSLICGFEGRNSKVCCDVSSPKPVTPPKPVPPPTPVTPPKPVPPPTPVTPPKPVTPPTLVSPLLPKQCGSANGERVFGGTELALGSYRWMALIGYGNSRRPDWNCGGSLISQRYVITAAHCADTTFTLPIVKVRLGEHDISKTRDCQQFNTGPLCALPVQDFNPENVIIHPDWNKRTNYSDDIALVRLDRPAEFNGYVQPICLPKHGLDVSAFLNGREAEVAGWGYTERKSHSDVKLMVELPFVPLEQCKPLNHLTLLEKGQVCFGGVKDKDSCGGDSGGPLVSTDLNASSTNLYILLGVVSYGPPGSCGVENRPAVYTDVAQYRNWIVSKLQP